MPPSRVVRVGGDDLLQELDFVDSCFGVVSSRLDDFESAVTVGPVVEAARVETGQRWVKRRGAPDGGPFFSGLPKITRH